MALKMKIKGAEVPVPFVAVSEQVLMPAAEGAPEIRPEVVLILTPLGSPVQAQLVGDSVA